MTPGGGIPAGVTVIGSGLRDRVCRVEQLVIIESGFFLPGLLRIHKGKVHLFKLTYKQNKYLQ